MRDAVVVRFWIAVVWVLNHIPFGPRFDLEITEKVTAQVELES